ncbi:MAG: T9SS type A sorting domain-containing protein [Bacteroidetes bacterium]|nr:T9SS type A sorting domain-containing protein [Bacteroidota bacterium]
MLPLPTDNVSLLGNKALWYAAAAGALLGFPASDADAQIVYVDIDPDLDVMDTFTPPTFAGPGVDFDGDGDAEIFFGEDNTKPYTLADTEALSDGPDGVTGIVGNILTFAPYYFAYFVPLSTGAPISAGNATVTGYSFATFTFGGLDPNGFIGIGDTYIGVQFTFDGATTHYAWLRVEMPSAGRILVKDFAYESTPDTPINAGQMVTAIEPGPDGLPGTHNLSAVYPNPFNPQARFTLEVAEQQNVNIAVFDALGRQVALLHDGTLGAGTIHEFRIDGANLPSGVYVVRAIGEHFTDVRQVTLIK